MAAFEHKALIEGIPRGHKTQLRRGFVVTHVLANKRARHAELHVRIDVLVIGDIDLGLLPRFPPPHFRLLRSLGSTGEAATN